MPTFFFFIVLLLLLSCAPHRLTCAPIPLHRRYHHHHRPRRILHQPFFPQTSIPPTSPPVPSPTPPVPKLPFSSTTSTTKQPFFPNYPSPPPPPSPSSIATFPANISSLIVPHPEDHKPVSPKLIIVAVILALCSLAFIFSIVILIYYRRRRSFSPNKTTRSDSHRLFPANTVSSDNHHKLRVNNGLPVSGVSNNSSEFLYLGTLVNSRGLDADSGSVGGVSSAANSSPYVKLGSPELHPLPPLSRHNNYRQNHKNAETGSSGEEDEEEFYSPRGSSAEKESPSRTGSGSRRMFAAIPKEVFDSRSSNSSCPTSNSASPARSISNSPSPSSSLSPPSLRANSQPSQPPPPPPLVRPLTPSSSSPPKRKPPSPSPSCSPRTSISPARVSNASGQSRFSPARNSNVARQTSVSVPPPPPPPPPAGFWETQIQQKDAGLVNSRPPVLVTPLRPIVFHNPAAVAPVELPVLEKSEETPKPKLKPLHWDKVRASSDRAMVWDQLKSSSFQLNEEMIETLFVVNGTNLTPKENAWRPVLPHLNQDNRVLDPKKSQNIAILLRALNVTIEEVCEALYEGNADTLGTELLESLLKMAPTKEEERKLIEYKDDSPFKLGPAERFLKEVLNVPFAFKRVDAMLYIANFDSEVDYLRKSFETLEAACEELRNSRMFMKLLEAVLKTGNRMNVGTNRGDAHAFKLDTLLKLVDVKGTDGKTTLLHFVVQEIIRAEGARISGAGQSQQPNIQDDVKFRKLGLQVVGSLSGELSNVKKSAAMDSDILSGDVSKLARGIGNIGEVMRLNEGQSLKESSRRFSESMNNFLKKAEEEIIRIQAQESVALSLVKEITEYFHGNSAREEAHPFRIFMVVRDFLSTLDQVCKEVGKINERTIVSSARQFPVPVNPTQPPVFPVFLARPQYSSSSSDEDSSSSS